MAARQNFTRSQIKWMRERYKDGWTKSRIAKELGCSVSTITRNIDDAAKARHREVERQRRERDGYGRGEYISQPSMNHVCSGAQYRKDAERLMAQIPEDTRNTTAQLMGDPLPGRSALDRRV